MASVIGNGAKGHHKFTLTVAQQSQSIANNTSTVSFAFSISPIETSWRWEQWSSITYVVTINGTKYTGTIPNYDGYSTVTLKSGTQSVTHNTNGSKSISFSFSVTDGAGQYYTCGNASGSGTLTLTTIPRYATSVQSLKSKTETSITMNWSSDNTVDYIWYSKDNGSTWTGINVTDGKSGTYTISGLSAKTTYKIKTRVRRKDSQLTTDSSATSITTYSFPTQSLKSKAETSITMNWSCDSTVDYIWYSKDNGSSWSGIDVEDGKSGSYTISGLSDTTTYKIKTRVRRKDTQAKSDSSALSVKTYSYPTQSLKSKTETSITMNWSCDSTVDYIWYSSDNGSTWTKKDVTDGTSGSYTIGGLNAYTTYKIKTRVRRKDTFASSDSSATSITTYNYPYCNNMPDFTIGDRLTVRIYNPLGRTFLLEAIGANGTVQRVGEYNTESVTGFLNTTWVNFWYSSIPNSQSGTYKMRVTYGSSAITKTGGTYKIKGTEKPTVGTITYADTNTTVTAITGNNQHIVQNQSNLKVTYGVATAKNSASISKYTFELNGVTKTSTSAGGTVDFGKINSANNLVLTVIVTDSRGLSSKKTKTITMVAHSKPTAIVSLKRLNNYEDETYLTVDGSVSSVNSKNTMAIKYRYKVSGGSYNSFTSINDLETKTLSLNKDNVYIFNIVVTDAFGTTYNKEHKLGKGVFPLFIDVEKNSVGINCLPTQENTLEVAGAIYLNGGPVFPVGSVFTTSTNTNPSTLFGGTWTLIDKEFKSMYVKDVDTGDSFAKSTDVKSYQLYAILGGHTIRLRFMFVPTVGFNSDDEVTIGTLNVEKIGVSRFFHSLVGIPAMSDPANGCVVMSLGETGEITVVDYIKSTTANQGLYINKEITCLQNHMLDDFCDKFYWKRTA